MPPRRAEIPPASEGNHEMARSTPATLDLEIERLIARGRTERSRAFHAAFARFRGWLRGKTAVPATAGSFARPCVQPCR